MFVVAGTWDWHESCVQILPWHDKTTVREPGLVHSADFSTKNVGVWSVTRLVLCTCLV